MGAKKRKADYEALERGMRKWVAATNMLKDRYTRERAALNSELARVFLESNASYAGAAEMGYLPKSTLQTFVAQYKINVANGVEEAAVRFDEPVQSAADEILGIGSGESWPETTWWEDGGFSLWRGYILIKYHHIDDPDHPMLHVWGRSAKPMLGLSSGARSIPLAPRGEDGVFLEGARAAIAKDPKIGYDFYSKEYGDMPTREIAVLLAKHPEFEYREYEVKG